MTNSISPKTIKVSLCVLASTLTTLSLAQAQSFIPAGKLDFGTEHNDQSAASSIYTQNTTWSNLGSYTAPDGNVTFNYDNNADKTQSTYFLNNPDATTSDPTVGTDGYLYIVGPRRPQTYTGVLSFASAVSIPAEHVMTINFSAIDVEALTVRLYNGTTQVDLSSVQALGSVPSSSGLNYRLKGDSAKEPTRTVNATDGLALDITGYGKHLVPANQVGSLPSGYPTSNYDIKGDSEESPGFELVFSNITGVTTAPLAFDRIEWDFRHQGSGDVYDNNTVGIYGDIFEVRQVPEPSSALLSIMGAGFFVLRRKRQ